MTDSSPSMLKSTLIGGLSLGILAAMPVIGVLNCACCALVIAGGFLAAFLLAISTVPILSNRPVSC